MIKNQERIYVNVSILITVVSTILCIYFYNNYSEYRNFAGAIIMVSLLFAVTGFVCILIFNKRSKALDKAINEDQYIAKWEYEENEWQTFKDKEYELSKEAKKYLFYGTTILIGLIFGIFAYIVEEGAVFLLAVGVGLIVLLAIVAFVIPYLLWKNSKSKTGIVLIMQDGVLVNKTYHSWDFYMSKFGKAKYNKKENVLEISYNYRTKVGPQTFVIRILVPEKKKNDVQSIIEKLEESNIKK